MKFIIFHEIWTIKPLSEDKFIKLFGDSIEAITMEQYKTIYLNEEDYTLQTIKHELAHAYYSCLCTGPANLTAGQVEEVWCEMVARYGDVILKQAKFLYKQLRKD
jgi:hypothetical protein